MKKKTLAALAALLCLAATFPARALQALRLEPGERITLDGRLDEPAWARAQALDRFWEVYPRDNVEAPVRTELRIAYDGVALYAAIHAYEPEPAQLRAPFARRDNVLADQDMLVLFLDPVGNRKFAHFFRVNPRGSVGDGLFNEDSQSEDFSPDFEFEVVTGRFAGGWTAEFRIPFSSLRYADPPSSEWTVMLFRNQPRDQRYRMSSSRLPRESTCFMCLNEPLTGLESLPSARHLELTPNITLRGVGTRDQGEPHRDESEVVPSLDIKWRPRPDVVIDATINPDFSQVELDTPQLAGNTQFALFFPEKRPFFLEGADIYEMPMRAIYTRAVTDPAWGVRATQRKDDFDGTVLATRDDGGGLVLLPGPYRTGFALQDFKSMASFARGRWQAKGATFGAMATDRTIEGGAYNRVAGADFAWFATTEHRFRGHVMGSSTTAHFDTGTLVKGEARASHALALDWNYRSPKWDEYLVYEDLGSDFRADNGFVTQNDYRRLYSETARRFLGLWGFNEVTPYLNAEYKTTRTGDLLYLQHNLGVRFVMPRATTLFAEVRPNNRIVVREGGETLTRHQGYLAIESNPFPWLARLFAEAAFGDRVDVANSRVGTGYFVGFQASVRPHVRAEVEYRLENDVIDAKEPVQGARRILYQRAQQLLALWHFSARDSVRVILQEAAVRRDPALWQSPVSAKENSSTLSLVYGHRRGIGTTFYVGATLGRTRDPDGGLHRDVAEVFVKGSMSFDLL